MTYTPSPNRDQDSHKIPIATSWIFLFYDMNSVKKHKNEKNCNLSFLNIQFSENCHFWLNFQNSQYFGFILTFIF